VDPMSDLADLQPLAPVVGDARIVGAGEATHGTREHFLYKHRLLRFLVTQKGFRALAFESPWPTGRALNQYVLGGEGDPTRLLGKAVFGVWYTQEVLDTIRWMREYNATVRPEQRVEFVGIDMQLTRAAASAVAQYLDRVDPQFRTRHASTLDLLAAKEMEGLYLEFVAAEGRILPRKTAKTRTISAAVREVRAHFDAQRERYIAASTAAEFDIARQHANILVQEADKCEDASGTARDRYMADNLDWYMARRPGMKVMVWAHNFHVAFEPPPQAPSLGRHLKARHGAAYLSVGFVLGSGAYRALDARNVPPAKARWATFTFGRPPARTLNALMAAIGCDIFAVDLRSARGRIRELLDRPLRIREGAGIVMQRDPLVTITRSLPATHDVLIFIDRTTPARPIRSSAPQRDSRSGEIGSAVRQSNASRSPAWLDSSWPPMRASIHARLRPSFHPSPTGGSTFVAAPRFPLEYARRR
jgi:erythromycin esterase